MIKLAPLFYTLPIALALAACGTVGPDYRVPPQAAVQRPAAQQSFAEAAAGPYAQDEAPAHWWRLYSDPVLDGLVEQAFAANTDLRVAQANLARAEAVAEEVGAQQRPSASVGASPTFGHASGVQALAPAARPRDRWSYGATAAVSYQVDLFGQIARAIESARADADSARAAYDATRVTVAAATARAYAGLCTAGMELGSARHSMEVQQESLDAVERLLAAGRGTRLDATRARAQLEQLRAALPPRAARRRAALYQLAALTGRAPAELPTGLADCATPPTLTQPIPVGDGAALLRRRPDIRQAERALAAATARIGVATGDLYPKITLGLNAGSAGPAAIFGERGTYSWSLGPLISWTIPDTGAVQARIAQAEAGSQAALARFDASVLDALRETETALSAYARQLDREAALEAARAQSAEAAAQAERMYRAGRSDYLSVLDAQRTLAGAEQALAASRAELADDQIAVFLALGGGWERDQ
ncbi:efflux transporter outer membrane subunit [Pigmentiphaga soli]|uniref:Efflux transporter outer membrane subunit n=1 Tax=Pigmentiphaga soli TaxID=1007095 RepID=A0ABP8HQK2_9BURK